MISRHLFDDFDVSSIENPYTLWLKTHEKAHGFLQSENRLLQELHAHALHEVSIFCGDFNDFTSTKCGISTVDCENVGVLGSWDVIFTKGWI
jgi:hypothetical protein